MAYGTLEHRFWEDNDLKEVGLECRAAAAYVLTCRHSTTEGYYRLSLGYASDDLGITPATVLAYLRVLDLKEFCRYDEASQVVFVRNAMRYRPPKGRPACLGALKRAADVPANPFRGLFYDAAVQFAPEFGAFLLDAGWCSDAPTEPTLFKHTPLAPPPPRELPAAPVDVPAGVEEILSMAASISVQQSIANREPIRKPEAVAAARLAAKRAEWTGIVTQWIGYFDVSPADMAKALADGGRASTYWSRVDA